jgi:hypothetical protein
MATLSVRMALIAISLGAQTAIALADGPPTLNVGPSCDAAARGAIVIGRDKQACMGDENAALDVLKKNWGQYNARDKVQCVGNVRTGGPASYVELLSCLEIMRDAKAIRDTDPLESPLPGSQMSGDPTAPSAPPARSRRHKHQQRS